MEEAITCLLIINNPSGDERDRFGDNPTDRVGSWVTDRGRGRKWVLGLAPGDHRRWQGGGRGRERNVLGWD